MTNIRSLDDGNQYKPGFGMAFQELLDDNVMQIPPLVRYSQIGDMNLAAQFFTESRG